MPLLPKLGGSFLANRAGRCRDSGQRSLSLKPMVEALEDRTLLAGDFGFALSLVGTGGTANAIATDHLGNVYITGSFVGTTLDFDPGPRSVNLPNAGGHDVFVAKYSSTGSLIWARSMGGAGEEEGRSIAVDSEGNVYTAGYFQSTVDFDPGPGVFNLTSPGDLSVFISKLDSTGNFIWARQLGGTTGSTYSNASVAVDGLENVYLTGSFCGTFDFGPGPNPVDLTSSGSQSEFFAKLDRSGSLVWAKQIGDNGQTLASGIAVDGSGNLYATGSFAGTVDFDPGPGVFNLTGTPGSNSFFVSKLDTSGNFVWARNVTGSVIGSAAAIAVDSSGNAFITGSFKGTGDFDPGADTFILSNTGDYGNIFVWKLDSSGNFVWARQMGGAGADGGQGLALDSSGDVYTTGSFVGTADFDPGAGTFNLTSGAQGDAFVSKLDGMGNFVWARQLGGDSLVQGLGIAVDDSEQIYTTGDFGGVADFDPGPGVYNLSTGPIFISQLLDDNKPPVAAVPGAQTVAEDTNLTISGISVSDPDVGTGNLEISLSALHGMLTLTNTTGLTFTVGDGSQDPSLTFRGSLTNVNNALSSLVYRANTNYSGSDTITLSVNDLGNTGSGGPLSDTKTITVAVTAVADAPRLTVADARGNAGAPISLTIAAALTDTDGSETLTITVQGVPVRALLSAGTNNGNGNWMLTASQLAGLTITTTDAGAFTLTVTATATEGSNGSFASATGAISVAVNFGRLHQRYVAQLYLDLLQRPVDATGLTHWVSLLDGGTNVSQVLAGLLGSQEYRTLLVQGLYQQFLHREADPAGLGIFVSFLGAGCTVNQVEAIIIGSPEYLQNRGGGSNDGFLSALYQDTLSRPIDSTGRTVFSQALANDVSRSQIAELIFGSDEFDQNLVQGLYQRFLGRAAEDGGLSLFVNGLKKGMQSTDVLATIVGSDEYQSRF